MVAPDCYWSLQFPALHQVVNSFAHLRAFTVAEPTDPGRQSLKVNSIARQPQPAIQRDVIRKQLQRQIISLLNITRITGQSHPTKGSLAFTEKRADVFRYEARDIECTFNTRIKRHLANVVSVIEGDCSGVL